MAYPGSIEKSPREPRSLSDNRVYPRSREPEKEGFRIRALTAGIHGLSCQPRNSALRRSEFLLGCKSFPETGYRGRQSFVIGFSCEVVGFVLNNIDPLSRFINHGEKFGRNGSGKKLKLSDHLGDV
jgi:hypothetical protein